MEQECYIQNKPIHIGLVVGRDDNNVYLLNDKHKVVYFTLPKIVEVEDEYFLFQYKDEEYTDVVVCIGTTDLFKLYEVDFPEQAYGVFSYGYPPVKAIIRALYNEYPFYYYIDYDFVIKPTKPHDYFVLNGNFSKEEGALLNYIYRYKEADFMWADNPEVKNEGDFYSKFVLPKILLWDKYKGEGLSLPL